MDWYIQDIIKRALQEDIGHQDITTDNLVDKEQRSGSFPGQSSRDCGRHTRSPRGIPLFGR